MAEKHEMIVFLLIITERVASAYFVTIGRKWASAVLWNWVKDYSIINWTISLWKIGENFTWNHTKIFFYVVFHVDELFWQYIQKISLRFLGSKDRLWRPREMFISGQNVSLLRHHFRAISCAISRSFFFEFSSTFHQISKKDSIKVFTSHL